MAAGCLPPSPCRVDILDVMAALKVHGKALPEGVTEELLQAINRLVSSSGGGGEGRGGLRYRASAVSAVAGPQPTGER